MAHTPRDQQIVTKTGHQHKGIVRGVDEPCYKNDVFRLALQDQGTPVPVDAPEQEEPMHH